MSDVDLILLRKENPFLDWDHCSAKFDYFSHRSKILMEKLIENDTKMTDEKV